MFVSFEGIDRSGKSTQATMLARALGAETLLVREPGGTDVGERVRALLKDPALELGIGAELLLFCAARAELVARVIAPAREAGRDIVCDRYVDSTVAYQAEGVGEAYRGEGGTAFEAGAKVVERLNALVVGESVPDLTLLIRVDPELALERGQQRLAEGEGDGADRFEARGLPFQRRVATAYDELALRHRDRFAVVEGDGTPEEVHARVLEAVRTR